MVQDLILIINCIQQTLPTLTTRKRGKLFNASFACYFASRKLALTVTTAIPSRYEYNLACVQKSAISFALRRKVKKKTEGFNFAFLATSWKRIARTTVQQLNLSLASTPSSSERRPSGESVYSAV